MKILSYLLILWFALASFSCKEKKKPDDGNVVGEDTAIADATLTAINERIKSDPANYQNYLERAKYFGGRERYKDALEDISRALKADSTKGDIYLYRGEVYWFQKNIDGAYDSFEDCIRFENSNTDCLLKKASIDIALDNYDKALEHINNALRADEQLPYAYYLKGRLYKSIQDTTLAASSYQTAIELDPDFYDAYVEVALLYASQQSDLAIEYYNTAIDLKPNSVEALYNKAMYLQETGNGSVQRYQQAFECYDRMQEIDPKNAAANFNKGFINLEFLQNYQAGEVEFSSAIAKFPQYYQAYYNRGLCNESLGKMKEAEADYRKALDLFPAYDDAAKALSRVRGE
ncbi:MAG: tetratricopeptide repeat protein [Flavobacteriales bacterium]|nr:tetratricopeptide repeat protein [Flavobacteriales bacterium]